MQNCVNPFDRSDDTVDEVFPTHPALSPAPKETKTPCLESIFVEGVFYVPKTKPQVTRSPRIHTDSYESLPNPPS